MVLATLMMAIGGPAWAQVYKCVTSDGKIEFSNLGCQSKASAQVVRSTPNEIDTSAQRNYLDRLEAQKLREQLDMQERTSKRLAQAQRISTTDADTRAELARSPECARASWDYKVASSRLTGERRQSARPEMLRMYAACGMREVPGEVIVQSSPPQAPMSPPAPPAPVPTVITGCSNGFCTDSSGAIRPYWGR